MKIGIIGAENSHTAAIAKTINVDKQVKGFRVDYVWGETLEFAKKAASIGKIPNIIEKSVDMIDKINAVIVDHRHPKYHLKAVEPFLEAGIPIFVDKPLCFRVDEGKKFLAKAKKKRVPVTSYSILTHQKSFMSFQQKIKELDNICAGVTYGPCDLRSQYGGVFYYGIHQVDMVLKVFGYNVKKVLVTKNGNGATGQLIYPQGTIVCMYLIKKGAPPFSISASGSNGTIHREIKFDKNGHLTGIKTFCKMFKDGIEPETHNEMLTPVAVLEALEGSAKSGKMESVNI